MKKRELTPLSEETQLSLHLGFGERYKLKHLVGKRYHLRGDKSKVFRIDEEGMLVFDYAKKEY